MCTSMWFISIVALLVVDVRTGASEQEILPHRCHQCSPTNSTSCESAQAQGWLTATCPSARPYCATVATGPDFASTLGCAAAPEAACSLSLPPSQTLELTCICTGHLCNAPFSPKLRDELLNFSSPFANDSALTEAFFQVSNFGNVSERALYKTITVDTVTIIHSQNLSEVTTLAYVTTGAINRKSEQMPRAEALKQQATVPSEDDEDESEGSGSYEDSRSRMQSHAASGPVAPSSLLPAEENKGFNIFPSLLILTLLILCNALF